MGEIFTEIQAGVGCVSHEFYVVGDEVTYSSNTEKKQHPHTYGNIPNAYA